MRAALVLSPAVVLLVFPAGSALAQAPVPPDPFPHVAVRLSFKTIPGCPPERAFRAEVASWVGYDPFTVDGADLITIWFERAGPVFSGSFTLTTLTHKTGAHTEVEASCTGLYRTMGIGVGLTIAPSDGPAPAAPPAEAPAEATAEPVPAPAVAAPPPPAVKPEPPAPPPKRNVGIHGGVDAVFNPFAAPSVSLGFAPSVGVRFRDPAISIDVGLRAMSTVKATIASNGDTYSWTYAAGVLAASIHRSFLFGGPVLEAGTLSPHSDHSLIRNALAPGFIAVGVQAGVERSFADLVILRASIAGEGVPLAAHLVDPPTGRLLWVMPSLSTTIAAGLEFHLW